MTSSIASKSYIGQKGYTIPKSALSRSELEFLKKDLFLKPEIHGPSFGATDDVAFPVYRENDNKIYIPRFYGIERYGMPPRNDLAPGEDINVQFTKEMRDYQTTITDAYMQGQPTVEGTYGSLPNPPSQEQGVAGGRQPPATVSPCNPLPLQGTYGAGGSQGGRQSPCYGGILEIYCGAGKCLGKDTPILMYDGTIKLVQDVRVGDKLMGDDSQPRNVLTLARGREKMFRVRGENNDSYIVNQSHILSLKDDTDEIHDIPVYDLHANPALFGYRVPITFPYKQVDVIPYVYGYNHIDTEIPINYKCNDRQTQLELLAGMIDAKGEYCEHRFYVPTKMNDILYISKSLGFVSYRIDKYNVCIWGDNLEHIPTRRFQIEMNMCVYERNLKALNVDCSIKTQTLKYRIKLEELDEDDYYGFEIDGNRRFLLGDFTVTHNTVMALNIVAQIQKKTLILVHKEFLMNQWMERIAEFLPGARVGKIQANVCDTANKDIVIGMIQTMYNKTFPQEVYSQFGMTIIDEVHRIGSEEFSKTLLKTITPYMLGISATVERKDGLTKLLHMFIGPTIYSLKRKQDDVVCVRGIEYTTRDADFNEVEYDFRGYPKYSTMISKLCAYCPRSDFIIRVIFDLISENPDSQIMVLAHNRSLLTYLHDTISGTTADVKPTIGYYVGGMKQKNLQDTETKQIVLATYAMAAEALDIKTLSTLVMITPKTDITQSVGRILRMKHDNPIIVDIIDTHELFQNQWTQRKRWYKKSNYKISTTNSLKYSDMKTTDWFVAFEPKTTATGGKKEVDEDKPVYKCAIDISNLG